MFLIRVFQALAEAKLPYAVVGGLAVSLHGAVRGTVDVDLVLRLKKGDFLRAETVLNRLGLRSLLPLKAAQVFDFREEYRRNRNLIAWSFVNPERASEVVDILLTEDLKEIRTEERKIGATVVRLASLKDLIRMKQKSGRPQDLADVLALQIIQKKKAT